MQQGIESSVAPVAFEAQVIFNALVELYVDTVDPLVYAASSDPDTLYLDQALMAPDREQFIKAMMKEVEDHESREHWELVRRDSLPKGTAVLPAVWSMRRKRRLATGEIYKWKARLTIHGGQTHGVNYWETYSPVVRWLRSGYSSQLLQSTNGIRGSLILFWRILKRWSNVTYTWKCPKDSSHRETRKPMH